jgi:molybdopterin-guanine dinucleotide biosynthesis protein A
MIAALVLAGGRSTRMGRDKARLVVGGERLVDRVAAAAGGALRAAGESRPLVLVSGPPIEGFECVADEVPGLGPVGGLASGLSALRARGAAWVLAVPVDLPALTGAALAPLLAAARDPVCAVTYAGHELPALLRVSDAVLAAAAEVAAAPGRDRAVWRLLQRLGAARLPLDPAHARAVGNANTPAELESLLRGGGES